MKLMERDRERKNKRWRKGRVEREPVCAVRVEGGIRGGETE